MNILIYNIQEHVFKFLIYSLLKVAVIKLRLKYQRLLFIYCLMILRRININFGKQREKCMLPFNGS